MSKKILITLDDSQIDWLDDFRFAQRFESRSEAIRWLIADAATRADLPIRALDRARRAAPQPASPEGRDRRAAGEVNSDSTETTPT